ncbi:RNA methylase, NOL1/NOP2/sun family [Rhodopirellula maiorica SM1]|uniref:RNA methylase, NOL1/NOP2/sun family n=1 Tax=Rhodopirellula maiorica SM1 TaxID=1265738 RepID=M5R9T9_9BACT|nr:RNA methylase, NOL1/NOP2/sun family [Rhodopirellula maiorica]EMI16150.1 RNA methylase, NOL1/NOP2/sun family [Rhodopirellula maiorica SM1]
MSVTSTPQSESFDDGSFHALVREALGQIELAATELDAFVASLSSRHRNVIRLRREVPPESLPFPVVSVPWYPLGYRCESTQSRPSKELAFAAGDYYVQDAGSLLALAALQAHQTDALKNQIVCDLCAAPGGKATAILEALENPGFLLANEPIRSRVPALLHNLSRTGSNRFAISQLDPDDLAKKLTGCFDVVVVDAPCSGQALLSRKRQSISALSPHQIEHSASRQQRILSAATRLLRPGGKLVYSTCTFAAAENEAQIDGLMDSHDFTPETIPSLQPYASPITSGCYRLWPHRHDCAGSFAASLIHGEASWSAKTFRNNKPAKNTVELDQWFAESTHEHRYFGNDSSLYAIPSDAPVWVERVAKQGPEIAHRTGKVWKPAHAAALQRGTSLRSLQTMDVDHDVAAQYLSGVPIPCPNRGWTVVQYHGRPLGWVKGDRGLGKNHLPTASRFTQLASPR